ncbi:MAG: hypothetical protein M3Y49_04085 [Actinomycetota bacterium]|nr:hypothetical protein [Actinomycetota bacterium]
MQQLSAQVQDNSDGTSQSSTMPEIFTHEVVERLHSADDSPGKGPSPRWFHARRDAYIDLSAWEGLNADDRHLVLAHIASTASPSDRLISHRTAAIAWGIPIIGKAPKDVDMLDVDDSTGEGHGIQRHRTQHLPEAVEHLGLRLTDPVRTAVDLARCHPLATGLAAMDDVLHRSLGTRDQIRSELDNIPKGGRGRRRAHLAAALADGLAESAAESLSRARLYELGMPKPQLQVRFDDSAGFAGRTDMYWPELDTIGEVDGRKKYDVAPGSTGEEAARALWREKRREDRLRHIVHRVARWGWDDAISPERFRRVLVGHGIRPRRDPTWITTS